MLIPPASLHSPRRSPANPGPCSFPRCLPLAPHQLRSKPRYSSGSFHSEHKSASRLSFAACTQKAPPRTRLDTLPVQSGHLAQVSCAHAKSCQKLNPMAPRDSLEEQRSPNPQNFPRRTDKRIWCPSGSISGVRVREIQFHGRQRDRSLPGL